ncbi:MAG: hypothetical protein JST25_03980 [Actinobacteria bacterium]|nr:hypothetical protein [Actinomycetota bacterium]
MTDVKSGLSRRTVIKGAAWSVPVIAAAATVPMAAASGDNVIGTWRESSLAITQTAIAASSPFVFCARDAAGHPVYDQALWASQPFKKTVTITYTGANDAFTFVGATTTSFYTIASVSQKSITLTHTDMNGTACSTGFSGFNLYFNSVGAGSPVPIAEIEPLSLLITASATAGDYVVNDIIDVTPCSPIWGEAPRGPREIPAKGPNDTCPNGKPSNPYA